jgi:tetratricopeptide (TPR) repeat protein
MLARALCCENGWSGHRMIKALAEAIKFELGALKSLEEALRQRPDFVDAGVRAAWISYQANEEDKARKYLEPVTDRLATGGAASGARAEGSHASCTRLKAEGIQSLLAGGQDDALRKFQMATEADSSDTDALYYAGDVAKDMGIEQADSFLSRCIGLDAANPLCTFSLIELRVYQDRFDDALSLYGQALGRGVQYPWFEGPVGDAKLAKGDLDGALTHFRALEQSSRRLGSLHFQASQEGFAAIFLYQGRLADARQQIISALQTSASDYDVADYYLRLGEMDAFHGRPTEARNNIREARKRSHEDKLALTAAQVYAMAGDFQSATEILHELQARPGVLGRTYDATEQFVRGVEAFSRNDLDRSLEMLSDANRFDPDDPDIAYYLAQVQMQEQRWRDAAQTLNGILNTKGHVIRDGIASLLPVAEYDLALCYERLGDTSQAASHLEAVRRLWAHADPGLKARMPRIHWAGDQ